MADDPRDPHDPLVSRRRVVIGGISLVAVGGLQTVIHPLQALAKPTYNLAFWRANILNIRITQIFAQAGVSLPTASVRVTQAFAQALVSIP